MSASPREPASDLAIRADGLRRRFGDLDAVAGVDLAIRRGEVYGFLGPNGAGKTTCVRMLCTLLAPTGGRAEVAGYDVVERPDQVRLRIGVALQEAALDPKQTGHEILRLQGRLYGLRADEVERRYREVAELVDIGDAMDRLVGTYSGGMRRRLDLATALMHNPSILFLDEPTTGLDPVSRAAVWDEVRRLNGELGITIFLTTQYLEEADALADRIGIINDGELVAEGAPAELKRRVGDDLIVATIDGPGDAARRAVARLDGVSDVELRDDRLIALTRNGTSVLGRVAVALDDAGVEVRELTLRTPTLDDVFFEITGASLTTATDEGGSEAEETR